jgi:hypothetical protein
MPTIVSPNPIATGEFGSSVSAGDQYVYIGALLESAVTGSGSIEQAGRAYIVDQTTGHVVHQLQSQNPSPGGMFGAVGGHPASGILAVGAGSEGSGFPPNFFMPGRAYLFDVSSGLLLQPLASPGGQEWGGFGSSVAVEGNLVVIGAPGEGGPGSGVSQPGNGAGRVYLYDLVTNTFVSTFVSPHTQASGNFGFSVSIQGGVVMVGAPGETTAHGHGVGAAYIFYPIGAQADVVLSSRHPTRRLGPGGSQTGGQFGTCVRLGVGDTGQLIAAVGAPGEGANGSIGAGRAYTFDPFGNVQLQLTSPNAVPGGNFGISVGLHAEQPSSGGHNVLLVGAPGETSSQFEAGNAYVFECASGQLLRTMSSPHAQQMGFFGASAAIGKSSLVVGAVGETVSGITFAGRAYSS